MCAGARSDGVGVGGGTCTTWLGILVGHFQHHPTHRLLEALVVQLVGADLGRRRGPLQAPAQLAVRTVFYYPFRIKPDHQVLAREV